MTFAATHPRGERKVSRWLSRASGGALLRLCLPFEEICFALFHFLKAPCLGKNKLSDVNRTKESGAQKLLKYQSRVFNILTALHPGVDFFTLGCF